MAHDLEIVSSDVFLDLVRGPLKDVLGEPIVGETLAVMQYSIHGSLVAQAVYLNVDPFLSRVLKQTGKFSSVRGTKVRVRYEAHPNLLRSLVR